MAENYRDRRAELPEPDRYPEGADTYRRLRADIRAEVARLNEKRKSYWYGALDTASINDIRRLDNRRELIVEIDLLIDKYETREKAI